MTIPLHISTKLCWLVYSGAVTFFTSTALTLHVIGRVQRIYPLKQNPRFDRGVKLVGIDWLVHFLPDPALKKERQLFGLACFGFLLSLGLILLAASMTYLWTTN